MGGLKDTLGRRNHMSGSSVGNNETTKSIAEHRENRMKNEKEAWRGQQGSDYVWPGKSKWKG